MLLDQKRTRRLVQVVAIVTSLAFAGVIFVVLGLIFFGGSDSGTDQVISDAKTRVEQEPRNPDAWDELASAYASTDLPKAVAAADRAVALAPRDLRRAENLASLQQQNNDAAGAINTMQAYTARVPNDAEGFLRLGQLAEDAGRTDLQRLAYLTFLRLAPDDRNADIVREKVQALNRG